MKKKIIFLDADGTLWYPKKTKRTERPQWVYHHPQTKNNYLKHIMLAPKVRQTLKSFCDMGIYTVIISAHPQTQKIALAEMKEKLEYFHIAELIHSYNISISPDPDDKATIITRVLKSLKLKKEDAVMVGDSYLYDYKPAKDAGVDAFLIENPFSDTPDLEPNNLQSINGISELLNILE